MLTKSSGRVWIGVAVLLASILQAGQGSSDPGVRKASQVMTARAVIPGVTFLLLGPASVSPVERLLPDTGITTCYNDSAAIDCPAAGEPFYGQDAQHVVTPMSYTGNGDGTVTDNATGLMWQAEDDNVARSWSDAVLYCEDLILGDHRDWRLPDEGELQSIMDYGRSDPAIDTTFFPGTDSGYYWSSSVYADDTGVAWGADFHWGYVFNIPKPVTFHVRCVRGGNHVQSFTDNGDGTVTDDVTGRMWQKQDDNVIRTWEAALAYCDNIELAGHTDWRLPDIKELRSVVDSTRSNPSINPTYFPETDFPGFPGYWSSSTPATHNTSSWYVNFDDGYVGNTSKSGSSSYVRCVR